ncbi:DUF2786 domain-containing protein [Desulfobacterium sp. N47]|uniref:DUF2786 domain-containing protein n=1 Tax=uncultured Desulfobacterium sp. TaxID=201089 RepID=E1Y9X8_9BACT|nr:hypothetical protein N47_H21940 [uncultured Desulfobacterium sp.]
MYKSKPESAAINEELERKILHGLALEWETARYLLDSKYRKFLRMPAFCLKDMKRRLGYWSGEKNEICINRDVALSRNWNFVKKILLHEIAHQVAQQIFRAEAETPHGPLFKKACYILRADYRASEDCSITNENIEADDRNTTILLRIKKLFALAESSNHNEAESAMKKAHELVAKYNIEIIANNSERNFISMSAGDPALRHPKQDYYLAGLLRDYYFVWTIWVPAYIIEKEKMGRVLELSGTRENIEIASYVHDFIKHHIESRWLEYNSKKLLNNHRKTDFATGIIKGFSAKLKSDTETKCRSTNALVKTNDPLLNKYIKYRYPHIVNISSKSSSCDTNILQDGVNIGKNLIISKGITKTNSGERILIE